MASLSQLNGLQRPQTQLSHYSTVNESAGINDELVSRIDKIAEQSAATPSSSLEQKNPSVRSRSHEDVDPTLLEGFRDDLRYFSDNIGESEDSADAFFKNIPQGLELEDVVNYIFKDSNYIIPVLDAVSRRYPSFNLSPHQRVLEAIAKDKEYALTNSALAALFEEHDLNNDEGKIADCYDLAYRLDHPNIYQASTTPALSNNYSLNFLWLNLNPQDRTQDVTQNIFKDGLDLSENADCIKDPRALRALEENEQTPEDWEKIKASFTYKLSRWADQNPGAQINLWYDSALVTEKARQKTFEMMKAISESRGVDLKLRDIRQLPNIRGETENTLHPGVPVYYRVDLLKVLIADFVISTRGSPKYCVVSDIDVEPMKPERIFDQRTLDYLSTNGYVFNRIGSQSFENNFFIFNKEKEGLQKTHNQKIIQQAERIITSRRERPINTQFLSENILDAQSIYRLYHHFRVQMGEDPYFMIDCPRKIVKSPKSQFNVGGTFPRFDHKAETFRFIGKSDVPYTKNGRNHHLGSEEAQIRELINWKAEPLPFVEPELLSTPENGKDVIKQRTNGSSSWKCQYPSYD